MTTLLEDWQYEVGGVLMGPGTPFKVAAVEGLGAADVRTADVEPPSEDGTWLGADYFAGRTIRLDVGIRAVGAPGAVMDHIAALTQVVADETVRGTGGATTDLRIKWPGRPTRVVRGRLRRAYPELDKAIYGWAPIDVEFQAADHLFYADGDPQSLTIPLGVISTAGFTAPVTAPITVGQAGDTSRPGWVDVDGTASAWPILTITGPCANPLITHIESGRVLGFTGSVGAGEWVQIDTRPTYRAVTRFGGGTTSLTPTSRIDAFRLPPGRSEIRWTATDPTNTCSLAVTWWPAYTAL